MEDLDIGIAGAIGVDGADGLDRVEDPDTAIIEANVKEDQQKLSADRQVVVKCLAMLVFLCSFWRFFIFFLSFKVRNRL